MDTKYFQAALEEWIAMRPENAGTRVGDLSCNVLSSILRRAQELKVAEDHEGWVSGLAVAKFSGVIRHG